MTEVKQDDPKSCRQYNHLTNMWEGRDIPSIPDELMHSAIQEWFFRVLARLFNSAAIASAKHPMTNHSQ